MDPPLAVEEGGIPVRRPDQPLAFDERGIPAQKGEAEATSELTSAGGFPTALARAWHPYPKVKEKEVPLLSDRGPQRHRASSGSRQIFSEPVRPCHSSMKCHHALMRTATDLINISKFLDVMCLETEHSEKIFVLRWAKDSLFNLRRKWELQRIRFLSAVDVLHREKSTL